LAAAIISRAQGLSKLDLMTGPEAQPMRAALLAVTLAMAAMAGGCQQHRSSASSADSHAPGTTTSTVPADCSKYPEGAPGVVRTFCDGPAVVTLTVAGAPPHVLRGGSCSTAGGVFSLNLGVVAGPDLAGPKPDYVGLTTPQTNGPFENAVLAIDVAGKSYLLAQNAGAVAPSGGNFAGQTAAGEAVSATFTC
jgi:hypothetical protein